MSRVKLKDVVMRVKDKVDKENTELEFYVGGEHIDGNEICVTRKGIIQGSTIGPAFHMAFKAGDVLLMSRNPHLRKASMVDFDGICSDVSYICRTKDEGVLLQSYLPFLLQSDDFWRFAEENKKGGLPFFLNWSDFERYEFELPSIEKQRELSDLLWSMQRTKQAYQELLVKTDELVKSQFIEMFGNPITNNMQWPTQSLKKVAPEHTPQIPSVDKYWWLNLDMIESYSGIVIEKVYAECSEIGSSTSTFDDTMVLYSKLRPYLNKVVVPEDFGYATTELVGLKPDSSVLNKYFLFNLLRGDDFVSYANGISGGAQMPRMPVKALREFECILPPMELQEQFVALSKQTDKSKFELKQNIENINTLMKSLMRQDFNS